MLRNAMLVALAAGASGCSFARCPVGCLREVTQEASTAPGFAFCRAGTNVTGRALMHSCQSWGEDRPVEVESAEVCRVGAVGADGAAEVECLADGMCEYSVGALSDRQTCNCPEPTQCRDTEGASGAWRDAKGRSCAYYARMGGRGCAVEGHRFEADGMTAHEACCACGGGDSVDAEAPTLPPVDETCADRTQEDGGAWRDAKGRTCARYARWGGAMCARAGHRFEADGMTANDACCVCGGGAKTEVCPPRVRKPYSELNCAERDHFVAALSKFREERAEEWHSFVDVHFAQFTYAHGTSSFLHWHRWYLINFENALRSQEGFACLTIPFWDWEKESGREAEALPLRADTFGSAAGLSNVTAVPFAPWFCVEDGIVAGWNTSATPFVEMTPRRACLMRQNTVGNPGQEFVSEEVLAGLIASFANFSEFRPAFEGAPHANPHIFIGGHMATPWSPNDPLFWMHHANVDRIFSVWQDFYGYDEVAKEDLVEPVHFHPEVDNRCEPAGCVDLAPQGLAPCPPGCNGTEVPGVCPPAPGCVALPPGVLPCTQAFCNPTPDFVLQADSPMAFGQFPAGPQGVPPPPFWLQGEVTARDMHRITEMTRESDRYTYGNCALAARLGEPLVGEWNLVTPAAAVETVLDTCGEPQACIMQCGTKVPHGWTGPGEGPEGHEGCNVVRCNDGQVTVLTRRACPAAPRCPPRESLRRGAEALERRSRAELCEAAKAACPKEEVDVAGLDMRIRMMGMNPATQGRFFGCRGLMADHCADLEE